LKRTCYISWEAFFMSVAQLAAQRSKDPSTQVGASIIKNNKIIGVGYNGFPNGCSDDEFPWEKDGEELDTKYPYVCHAELNAILNAIDRNALEGATMYITLFPCNVCAQMIIQSGITKVVYLEDKYHDRNFSIAARRMFDAAGIVYQMHTDETLSDVLENL